MFRLERAWNIAARLKGQLAQKTLANILLRLLHQLGKAVQSCQRMTNANTRLTTRQLFVGPVLWESVAHPFLQDTADDCERESSALSFMYRSKRSLKALLPKEFHAVEWPNHHKRNDLVCSARFPFVVYYNSTTGHMRATFSCKAEVTGPVAAGSGIVVVPGQRVF